MIDLKFNLLRTQHRPVFPFHYAENKECLCMYDTGAQTPIYCRGVHSFLDFARNFGNVTDEGSTLFYGFGKDPIGALVFRLDDFAFCDDFGNCIHYKNFKVLVIDRKGYGFDFILPATMFNKMKYYLDYTASVPVFGIRASKDTYHANFKKEGGPFYLFLTD